MPLATSRAVATISRVLGTSARPRSPSCRSRLRQRHQRDRRRRDRRRPSCATIVGFELRAAESRTPGRRSAGGCSASDPSARAGSRGCTRRRAESPDAASSSSPVLSIGRMRRSSVSGWMTTTVSGARFDDLVEIADRAEPRRQRERAVEPDGLAAANQIAAGEVAGREIVVAGDGDERPARAATPCARRSASCRSRSAP